MLIGAVNSENEAINKIKNLLTGEYGGVPDVARHYKVRTAEGKGAGTGLLVQSCSLEAHHYFPQIVCPFSFVDLESIFSLFLQLQFIHPLKKNQLCLFVLVLSFFEESQKWYFTSPSLKLESR